MAGVTRFLPARLVLSWWAEQMRLWVDGVLVHEGDLFDTACRWPLPRRCRQGRPWILCWSSAAPCMTMEP